MVRLVEFSSGEVVLSRFLVLVALEILVERVLRAFYGIQLASLILKEIIELVKVTLEITQVLVV